MSTGILANYPLRPGALPLTSALRNLLEHQGVQAPHTRRPVSEAMLLGLGGGPVFGWDVRILDRLDPPQALVVLGFHKGWRGDPDPAVRAIERLGGTLEVRETTGEKTAVRNLRRAVRDDKAPIVWVDQAQLPHRHAPRYHDACHPWQLVVLALDDDADVALLDDQAERPIVALQGELHAARTRMRSLKHRVATLEAPAARPTKAALDAACREGIRDAVATLRDPSRPGSLAGLKRFAELIVDEDSEHGWARLYASGWGLYTTLRSTYEGLAHQGGDGEGLRGIYASFLEEAAKVTGESRLRGIAGRYRELADPWRELTEAVLPESAIPLANTRILLDRKIDLLRTKGSDASVEVRQVSDDIEELADQQNQELALSASEVRDLLGDLHDRLLAIHEAEIGAVDELAALDL